MIIIVIPNSLLIFLSNSNIEDVVCGSNALVASSQRSIFGLVANALAIATLCFCPPESCAGYALFSLF